MIVETKSASLNTMSVTIQALHVEGKQMTLAVFRQLPIIDVNEDCSVWGRVLYSIKDEGDEWFVFSYKNCLYKNIVSLPKFPSKQYWTHKGWEINPDYEDEIEIYEGIRNKLNLIPQLFIAV